MTIQITGFKIHNGSHEVIIYADNIDYAKRAYVDFEGDVKPPQVAYTFDTTKKRVFEYVTKWLKSQKSVKDNLESIKTYSDAFTCIIGTVVQSPNLSFCSYEYLS